MESSGVRLLADEKIRKRKERIVAALCALGAAGGAVSLYLDLTETGGAGKGPPMAVLERREAKVRRKAANSFSWSNVEARDKLYRKESVQTGEDSSAVIRLNGGTVLQLGANSLVVIDDQKDLSLDFLQGSVVMQEASGAHRLVTRDKSGRMLLEDLPVTLLKPDALAMFFVPEGAPGSIDLGWEASGRGDYAIEVSTDRSFRADRTRAFAQATPPGAPQTTLAGAAQAKPAGAPLRQDASAPEQDALRANARQARKGSQRLALGPGRYSWRAVSRPGGKVLSQVSEFQVVAAEALEPAWPARLQRLAIWGDSSAVPFRWAPPEGLPESALIQHLIQVATDPSFRTPVAEQPIVPSTGTIRLKGLPQGRLYWRIASRYGPIGVTSRAESFELDRVDRLGIELVAPEDQSAQRFQSEHPELRFAWSAANGGAGVENVEFGWELQSADGSPVASWRGPVSAYAWKKPAEGAYRWRVTAYQGGKAVGDSPWASFSAFSGRALGLISPAPEQKIWYWDQPAPFGFEWQRDPLLAQRADLAYRVELAADRDFRTGLLGFKTRDNTLASEKLALAPRTWFWRVRIVDGAGRPLKSSEPARFAYGPHPPLSPPEATGPAPGASFNPVATHKYPTLSWAPPEGSAKSEVTVYQIQRGPASSGKPARVAVLTQLTDRNSIDLSALPEGTYQWTVRAIDRRERKGEAMEPRAFTIGFGSRLAPPKALSPEVQ